MPFFGFSKLLDRLVPAKKKIKYCSNFVWEGKFRACLVVTDEVR